jgi:ribosomal protein L11 methyltransferase
MDVKLECYCLHINPLFEIEEAWEKLESSPIQLLYSSEDFLNNRQIFAMLEEDSVKTLLAKNNFIEKIKPCSLEIDWTSQWIEYGRNFYDGLVHVDLSEFSAQVEQPSILKLEPGPGFGDLSHPTTRLVLKMLGQIPKLNYVIDIGSGSGILALAAAALGALLVDGIDIDPAAIEHAKQNSRLNCLENKVTFSLPNQYTIPSHWDSAVILMNMIWTEQIVAWKSLEQIHHLKGDILVSGLLLEDRGLYLEQAAKWGWFLKSEFQEENWLGLFFIK